MFLLHEEKVASAREAAEASKHRGSATLLPKLSQLLWLGWVMQVSSSVTQCLKITDKLQLLQPPIKRAALLGRVTSLLLTIDFC